MLSLCLLLLRLLHWVDFKELSPIILHCALSFYLVHLYFAQVWLGGSARFVGAYVNAVSERVVRHRIA